MSLVSLLHDSAQGTALYSRVLALLDAITTAATLSLPELPGHLARALSKDIAFERLGLWLVDEKKTPTPVGNSAPFVGYESLRWVIANHAPLNIRDMTREHRPGKATSILSALLVPLQSGNRLIGVLGLGSTRRDAFSADDEYVLLTVARSLAAIVENARLHQETTRRLAEMTTLYDLAQRMNSSLDLQDVLKTIVTSLKDTLKCRGCSIALLDPTHEVLEIAMAAGIKPEWERRFRLRLGEGIAGRVALEGRPIYVPDTLKWEGFIFFDPSVRSLLTVPLVLKQRIIGTLSVDSDKPHAFTGDDERLLTIAATQAAAAIENARLYSGLEQQVRNLAEAYAELKKTERLRDEFVQNVSHELRIPLTFVRSYVELLLEEYPGPLTADQRKYLEIIAEKTNTMSRLVNDIMELQQAGAPLIRRSPVSLSDVVHRAVEGCAAAAARAGLKIVEQLPEERVLVIGDEHRLIQVFDNLLGNAIKFSPNGGQIVVRLESTRSVVRASVSDQGIGIPKEEQARIFDRFYRVDGSGGQRIGGSGLGLAIVKSIVEAHGGEVWVESEPGKGSTFYVSIPQYRPPRAGDITG
ncbi:MAG: GAF domain-containing protein [Anaerolineae bacterium]|nr:GAF domain-containing protein [Anaerolineae bacterium]